MSLSIIFLLVNMSILWCVLCATWVRDNKRWVFSNFHVDPATVCVYMCVYVHMYTCTVISMYLYIYIDLYVYRHCYLSIVIPISISI